MKTQTMHQHRLQNHACHPTKKPSQSLRSTRITRSSGKKSLFLAKLWRERKEVGFSCLVRLSVSFCVLGVPTNYLFKTFLSGKSKSEQMVHGVMICFFVSKKANDLYAVVFTMSTSSSKPVGTW